MIREKNCLRKRLCIFSFYDKDGHADEYIFYLLKEISLNTEKIMIVVNGFADEESRKKFLLFTDSVFVRENKGFDAGAYKYILNILTNRDLEEFEEIIFCNDTFFGPLFSLKEIFKEMEQKECDFWGLNGFLNVLFGHIQSYFMVFRKSIIQSGLLKEYFKNRIDDKTEELNMVYCQFETGLYDFLVREHDFKAAIFADPSDYDIYRYSYKCISQYRLPIVKKKSFSDKKNDQDNMDCTLSFIKFSSSYNVKYIIDAVNRCYDLNISMEEIKGIEKYKKPSAVKIPKPENTEAQIENFLSSDKFYIYGAGMYACKTYWRFARENKNFLGFIISDDQECSRLKLFKHPISRFSDIHKIENTKVILGVKAEYAEEVIEKFANTDNVIRIF